MSWRYFFESHHDLNSCKEFPEAKLAKCRKQWEETFHYEEMVQKDFIIIIPQPIYDDYLESFIEEHVDPNEEVCSYVGSPDNGFPLIEEDIDNENPRPFFEDDIWDS